MDKEPALVVQVFADPPEGLLATLDKKANESAKYKGKKEKRAQRATFREIYNSFEVERVTNDGFLHSNRVFRKEPHHNSRSNSAEKRWKSPRGQDDCITMASVVYWARE